MPWGRCVPGLTPHTPRPSWPEPCPRRLPPAARLQVAVRVARAGTASNGYRRWLLSCMKIKRCEKLVHSCLALQTEPTAALGGIVSSSLHGWASTRSSVGIAQLRRPGRRPANHLRCDLRVDLCALAGHVARAVHVEFLMRPLPCANRALLPAPGSLTDTVGSCRQ